MNLTTLNDMNEALIHAVEKRPAPYDKTESHYGNRRSPSACSWASTGPDSEQTTHTHTHWKKNKNEHHRRHKNFLKPRRPNIAKFAQGRRSAPSQFNLEIKKMIKKNMSEALQHVSRSEEEGEDI
ncbi:hypothetical protein RRG08_049608 [Elysia crispata]|uniref:Uncharacterized protein n=1 Tax=Elysia crispata TaxID=231223 RepID=A0AAE1AUN4_9GAST|nr:hypothetical protein RRG08_049608 [Elysia crispata]